MPLRDRNLGGESLGPRVRTGDDAPPPPHRLAPCEPLAHTGAMPSDFRLYHSNALDVLARMLAHEMAQPMPHAPLLAPEVVLIPQAAMRRWLQATLAREHGIAANIAFLTPGEFVRGLLDANVPGATDDLDAAALRWRLYAALSDPAVLARPALAPYAAHVAGDDPLRAWALAGELAGTFEKYSAWRRDWLLRWDAGAEPGDAQAELWRAATRGRSHRARRIQAFLDRFDAHGGRDDAPVPAGLPPRLFAFATLNISPDVLRVVACAARAGPLHFYVHSPVAGWWGDLQHRRAPGTDADDHPLLRAWGQAGRDFMEVLGGYEVVHAAGEVAAHADPIDGGDTLLRRLQSDLLHRRPRPELPPRAALDVADASLQVHACATRLREVEVLHDQLRALFDDDRFDPPLEPREVAVLAPDIDPYAPYLEAVFGARGAPGAIPYALADASPLAAEPLAGVFSRLLALPVSRFGLAEVLALVASPALAGLHGLDAATLERLHGWLHAAGARWGLDAAHRARSGAPEDDATTWAFALDRLLLGHATGSEDAVGGIAPLPVLEGDALAALDRLLRLLRVLARAAATLAAPLPPAAWRERLLALLAALVPRAPDAATARTLDRLRSAIDAFARDAGRAGFEGEVPPEAVRAHFAQVLGEADTRAPLLTGAVSVGRMVPMRLLPFRVVCVLGFDDGAFPRRDPAGGLNRLAAELGTTRRRAGDRSTREDDRFLLLQLLTSAQDVFYVSYRGIDARDGSARAPSVLVADLLEAVAAQHAPQAATPERVVVRHPLQPFAGPAFGGDGEPRRFSYRAAWWPAASQAHGPRTAVPAWFDGTPLPPRAEPAAPPADLPLDALRRFLEAPADAFLRQRLAVRMDRIDTPAGDLDPLHAPSPGRDLQQLQRAVFDAALAGRTDAQVHADLRARGLLPSGALGRRTLAGVRDQVQPYADALAAWRGAQAARTLAVEASIDGVRLHARLRDAHVHGVARLRFGAPHGPSAIRDGLDWLLASASDDPAARVPLVQFHDRGEDGVGPFERPPLDQGAARARLAMLLALRERGLREPLAFAPYAGWALFEAGDDLEAGMQAAARVWHGDGGRWREGEGDALRLALRGRDPFADAATRLQFAELSKAIYDAVVHGTAPAAVDAAALSAMDALADAYEDAP